MAIANFARCEQKYRLSAAQYQQIFSDIARCFSIDEYGQTLIISDYYDTPTWDSIERSLEKPLYKEKLRLRSYGIPESSSRVFVEMKKKFDGIVYKRRVGMSYLAARAYLAGADYEECCRQWPLADAAQQEESLSALSRQISREINAMMARNGNLEPAMRICCQRRAFRPRPHVGGSTPQDLRITFDEDITGRVLLGSLVQPAMPLLGQGEVIMEIKTAWALPMWLVDTLNGARAYPQSFSKYGTAHQLEQQARMSGDGLGQGVA